MVAAVTAVAARQRWQKSGGGSGSMAMVVAARQQWWQRGSGGKQEAWLMGRR
jgi:hypothetical protein